MTGMISRGRFDPAREDCNRVTVEELTAAVGFLITRYLHIVCTAFLVGGTLFYEMVVPVAVGDMTEGQQLAVMGRSRWVFRWIVWVSGLLLIGSGVVSAIRHWPTYSESPAEEPVVTVVDAPTTNPTEPPQAAARFKLRSGWWFVAHASTGFMAVLIAVALTLGGTPPARPVQWMRLNLVILLIVIFLGTVAREVRLTISERREAAGFMPTFFPGPLAPVDAEHD
jgi:hypothetical protein